MKRFVQPVSSGGQPSPQILSSTNNNDNTVTKPRKPRNRQFYPDQVPQQTNRSKSNNSNPNNNPTYYNSFTQPISTNSNAPLLMPQQPTHPFIQPTKYSIAPLQAPSLSVLMSNEHYPTLPINPSISEYNIPDTSYKINPKTNFTKKINNQLNKTNKANKPKNVKQHSPHMTSPGHVKNTDNKQKVNDSSPVKINNFELHKQDEESWPTLMEKKLKSDPKDKGSSEDEERRETESIREVREPYVKDKLKLEKLIKNVNFIKKTVEQHYLSQNERISGPSFSFKDALLKKPKQVVEVKRVDEAKAMAKKTESAPVSEPESTKEKRKRTRRKKKKSQSQPSSDNPDAEKRSYSFDLTRDFPELGGNHMESNYKSLNQSITSVDEKSNFQSEAYSSGLLHSF